ncbi:hypothetical protein CR51_14825 [Caballeronia megalochromosomata]|nr:hypothetical protein CR51_14825 [Caballeronia megalochromosomata]
MSHVEPRWGFADPQVPRAEFTDHVPVELNLPVSMGSRLRKRWGEVRARSFENKGTVHVDDHAVTIQTSVSRLLRSPLRKDLTLLREDIYNVRLVGKIVQFDLVNGPGELETIVLRAHRPEHARLLVDALPTQMTRTYATENHERLRFLERINVRTPYAWATWTIVALATIIYFMMVMRSAGRISSGLSIDWGSNFGPYTQEGQWWRLLTSVFIHGSFLHLFFNMIVLARFGRVAERLFGTARFAALYAFAGLTGSLVSLLWHPGINSLGASGAIYGVLGATIAYLVRHGGVVPRAFYLRHLHVVLVFIAYTLPSGFRHHGIDNGAHLGGLFGGFVLGLLLAPPPDGSTETRDQRMLALGMAAAIGSGLTAGMMWALGDLAQRPERQEAMAFSKVIVQSIDLEKHAIADVNALSRLPATAEGRMIAATQIRGKLLPEWQQLYDSTEAAKVPPDSTDDATRANLLTYYGEMLKLLKLTANMIESKQLDAKVSNALITLLVKKVDQERTRMLKRAPK